MAHSLSTSSDLISTVFPVWGGKTKDERTCYNGLHTCYCRISWEKEDHVQKENIHLWTKGSPPIEHVPTSSGLCLISAAEGMGGKEPGQAGGCRRKSRWMARTMGMSTMARKSAFIPQSSTLWGGQ